MFRVAISGKANSGKNTVAQLIVRDLGYSEEEYKINAFANPIKQIIKIMFPEAKEECLYGKSELRSEIIPGDLLDEFLRPLTYRKGLTDLGKHARKYNDRAWVNVLGYDLNHTYNKKLYIVSDLRFIWEKEYLDNNGFFTVRIKRNGIDQGTDISETQQDSIPDEDFDFVIENNSSKEDLFAKVQQMTDIFSSQ